MFLTEGSNFARMKNKYLNKILCITILAAMVLSSPLSTMVFGEDEAVMEGTANDEEKSSEQVTPAPVPDTPAAEPTPTPVPDTPEAEPTPTPVPDTPEAEPTPTPAPDTPTEEPTPTPTPDTPTEEPTPTPVPDTPETEPTLTPIPEETEPTPDADGEIEITPEESEPDSEEADTEISQTDAEEGATLTDGTTSISETGKTGTPVYYVSNLHAGKEFYLDSLKSNYQLSFSDDFASVMDQIEAEYKEANGLTDLSDTRSDGLTSSADSLLVRNWQDILAVYIYELEQQGVQEYVLDSSCKADLARIFAEMNPIIRDEENAGHVSYGNYHINQYIKQNKISQEDRSVLKKYVETDCKLLCAIVTDAKGFVRQSVGDDVSEERVNVITAAYALVGEVGYFWGGKSTELGMDSSWGSAAKVSAEGSPSTGSIRAFGLDCSGFVTWSVINGYQDQDMQSSVGDGTSSQWENANVVSEQDAQPGDLVFQSGPEAGSNNHVGIICGRTDAGDWIAVHCSSSKNGVTVGEAYGASFRYIRQPSFYPSQEEVTQMENEAASLVNAELPAENTDLADADVTTSLTDGIQADHTLSLDAFIASDSSEDTDETVDLEEIEVVFEETEDFTDLDDADVIVVSPEVESGAADVADTLKDILDQNVSVSGYAAVFPQKPDDEDVEIIFED